MPQTLARLPWCLERKPDIVLLDIATNDIASDNLTLEKAIERYEALLKPLRDAGYGLSACCPLIE